MIARCTRPAGASPAAGQRGASAPKSFSVLSKSDLDSYFGKAAGRHAALLLKSRQKRDWIAHLDWMALFLGPFWALQ